MFKDAKNYDMTLKGKYARTVKHKKRRSQQNQSQEWQQRHREHNLRQKNPVMTPLGYFIGTAEAAKAHGYKCKDSIIAKCRSNDPKFADWYYVVKKELDK